MHELACIKSKYHNIFHFAESAHMSHSMENFSSQNAMKIFVSLPGSKLTIENGCFTIVGIAWPLICPYSAGKVNQVDLRERCFLCKLVGRTWKMGGCTFYIWHYELWEDKIFFDILWSKLIAWIFTDFFVIARKLYRFKLSTNNKYRIGNVF